MCAAVKEVRDKQSVLVISFLIIFTTSYCSLEVIKTYKLYRP